jgi:hypothetical protein
MDKVKIALAILRKHHFWFLCGVVVLLALVIWTTATADLVDRFTTRKTALESLKSSVQSVNSKPDHPNRGTIGAIQSATQKLKGNVFATWQFLHGEQKEKNTWPRELGQDFLNVINSLKLDEEIPPQYLERYHNFIVRHFPALFEILDVRLPAQLDEKGEVKLDANGRPMRIDPFAAPGTTSSMAPMGMEGGSGLGARGGKPQWVGKVLWNDADLRRVKSAYDWDVRPSSQQVRLAQEDLWVYEALLRIIRLTNEGATRHDQAAIKRLETLEIGRAAAASFQRSAGRVFGGQRLGGGMEGGENGGMPSGDPMASGSMPADSMGSMGTESGMPGGPEGQGQGPSNSLLAGRYVDQNLQPLAAESQPFAEFKMMPIHMILVMDQRKIPKLLVNCANSSMTVEVRMLSIRPGQGRMVQLDRFLQGSGSGGSGMGPGMGMPGMEGGSYGGGGSGYGGGYGGGAPMEASGPGMMGDGMGRAEEGFVQGRYDLPVEIQGIIYIFNPPDIAKLGTGEADHRSAAAAAPEASPPATAAPAAPAATGPAPAGPAPAGPAAGPAPAGPAPAGPAPAGPAPAGPAPAGPAPTGPAPTGPAPAGPAPTGPAPAASNG